MKVLIFNPDLKVIKLFTISLFTALTSLCLFASPTNGQALKGDAGKSDGPDVQWFRDAKFGMFIHWGLFSHYANQWNGERYYGIGEWLMARGKIPASDYAARASEFNPVNFNAGEWAELANNAGMKYMVITAKHHDGFAIYDSEVSDFDIVDATPYKKDPLKDLSVACAQEGVKLGFYYSQFYDWHEPNGGRNNWDFDESKKDYRAYYNSKSIPQIRELLSNYGPLGLIWFDMPGGLTKEETQQLIDEARRIQPNCLLSSRVGQGLGDFRDFGDCEMPPTVMKEPWESIFTHNNSWGYSPFDFDFKSSDEIIRLLAEAASKGGNLMLNVGPKGDGTIPEASVKCLLTVGKWLEEHGESIYGTSYGPVGRQPWGVTTLKPGKLFLHVFETPHNGIVHVPGINATIKKAFLVDTKKLLRWKQSKEDAFITLSGNKTSNPNQVICVEFDGKINDTYESSPQIVSRQFERSVIDVAKAKFTGMAELKSITHSRYFGDWRHTPCIVNMQSAGDAVEFSLRFTETGDYKISLEYSCDAQSANQEGAVVFDGKTYYFQTLRSAAEYHSKIPLTFIQQAVALVDVDREGVYTMKILPVAAGKELFKLSRVIVTPMR